MHFSEGIIIFPYPIHRKRWKLITKLHVSVAYHSLPNTPIIKTFLVTYTSLLNSFPIQPSVKRTPVQLPNTLPLFSHLPFPHFFISSSPRISQPLKLSSRWTRVLQFPPFIMLTSHLIPNLHRCLPTNPNTTHVNHKVNEVNQSADQLTTIYSPLTPSFPSPTLTIPAPIPLHTPSPT